jgi:hypothetical protein
MSSDRKFSQPVSPMDPVRASGGTGISMRLPWRQRHSIQVRAPVSAIR